jgi:hypothetical protein
MAFILIKIINNHNLTVTYVRKSFFRNVFFENLYFFFVRCDNQFGKINSFCGKIFFQNYNRIFNLGNLDFKKKF